MAYSAAFAGGLMLEDERAALGGMTLKTGFIFGGDHRAPCFDGWTLVRIMAVRATDFVFEHRMMGSQLELATLIEVALETGFRGTQRIDNRARGAAGLNVNTSWAMA